MRSYDNAYSRFIAAAKIVFPLAALGLLSTLFLISRDHGSAGTGDGLPYAKVEIDDLLRQQRLGAPNYAGVTRDGTAISMRADSARSDPDRPGRGEAQAMQARLTLPDGSSAEIEADTGSIDTSDQVAVLEGDARISTSTGYTIETDRLRSAFADTNVEADGPVTANGPPGRIEAGSMTLSADPADKGRYLLVFKDGVRLIYEPEH
ncbi:hypothetical protein DSD19_07295 [Rhodovulum sp. BSW8]|uniref:Lipopolysaccharide export system protein LptC n=1 Tax=Rhodovulum visakhapatnamense TaxID=364297 RepID=A0A4R8FXH6_9RHOB|nr:MULTISPECIES: LPS export ABC transporter periplasmic protein LptC [Rhodovulum]RBO53623.1 hypothetical protein DSD19_07295 [Rhodovulum sp. BSW8]TDX28816.1 lipopolysaccharide export system protein LptC [Rhodovulum visakhapatnamense]